MPTSNKVTLSSRPLIELCSEVSRLQQQAEALGLFTGMRNLLTCPHCGLQEDVLIDGRLVTHHGLTQGTLDSGLRFIERNGLFVCPQCGQRIEG